MKSTHDAILTALFLNASVSALEEARIALPCELGRDVLLPDDRQRHMLAFELAVHCRPVGLRMLLAISTSCGDGIMTDIPKTGSPAASLASPLPCDGNTLN